MMMIPRKRRNEFDLWDDFFGGDDFFEPRFNFKPGTELMKTDIKEKKDKYVVEIDLPGCSKENINLSLDKGYLNVSAKIEKESNDDKDEKYIRKERFYGECSRNFYVGDEVKEEDIFAEFKNGILRLEVPKKEEHKELDKPKTIMIN